MASLWSPAQAILCDGIRMDLTLQRPLGDYEAKIVDGPLKGRDAPRLWGFMGGLPTQK